MSGKTASLLLSQQRRQQAATFSLPSGARVPFPGVSVPQPPASHQLPPTGLDAAPAAPTAQPPSARAAALPGTPGHAATNVIDRQGALDPRGLTVDGNNAAGVPKSLKLAGLLLRRSVGV